MPVLLCFGDSNTHGTLPIAYPSHHERHDSKTRWPRVAQQALGPDWDLIEEGLPGRTAAFPDPLSGSFLDGRDALRSALQSHAPIDVLTIMLGTNDVKARFGASVEQITGSLATLLDIALDPNVQARHGKGFKVLLIAPAPVYEAGELARHFYGSKAKSEALPAQLEALAKHYGVGFFKAGDVMTVSPVDGVHFEASEHLAMGKAIAPAIAALCAP